MTLFDILNLKLASIRPANCKIHLAVWNGRDEPLDKYLAGEFKEWQEWQGRENFQRPYIVSLIRFDSPTRWLFGGVYSSDHCMPPKGEQRAYKYATTELPEFNELVGRLVIRFERESRQSYLRAENWTTKLKVEEIKPARVTVGEFPGFTNILVNKAKLDIIVSQEITSW